MNCREICIAGVASLVIPVSQAAGPRDFQSEATRATSALHCPKPKLTPAEYGMGALYGCIVGNAETVKFFINQNPDQSTMENAKLMWNDWFKDTGYGIHADQTEATQFVKAFASLYAPQLEKELSLAFASNEEKHFDTSEFSIVYTYKRGPAIDERLFVATPK